jgi:RimJ/RimL family protein N-acetyltransferase
MDEVDAIHNYVDDTIARFRLSHQLMQPPYGDFAIEQPSGVVIGLAGYVPSYGPFGLLPWFQRFRSTATGKGLNTAEWGLFWVLGADARGKGYATEAAKLLIDYAFERLGLLRIVATTEHDNLASIAVMRRLGMVVERNPGDNPEWFQVVGILENPRAG